MIGGMECGIRNFTYQIVKFFFDLLWLPEQCHMNICIKIYIGKCRKKYIFNKAYNRFVHMLSLLHQHFSVEADPLYLKNK